MTKVVEFLFFFMKRKKTLNSILSVGIKLYYQNYTNLLLIKNIVIIYMFMFYA